MLAAGAIKPERARLLARQIAEDLCAAHRYDVSHGELKPHNIALVGSGKSERAVITGFGDDISVRSDIYAFGQVPELLLPGFRLASECVADNPSERPDSFELVLEELQDF